MNADPQVFPSARDREIFLGALELANEQERAAFLEEACGGDRGLRQRIEALLKEEPAVGAFLETPALGNRPALSGAHALGPSGTAVLAHVTEKAGDRIENYKLLQPIGEGGCGVVYMAEQEKPVRRRVALKVIKLGMDTKSVIARFEAERQALAMMDHPNIAKVLDAGATETGRPFFVMELVRGIRMTEYCDENNLSTEQRLRLFIEVCHAIQHAHQKGIIHRDIKPSNILVTLHDGHPVPKVIDFGIAKATEQRLTDKTLFTEFQSFIGTPAYMSPEQAEMSGLDIDTRTDIYSLGVLLYELLIGKTPFDAEDLARSGLDQCRKTIREEEPIRPSTRLATMLAAELTTTAQQRRLEPVKLIHLLRGDLDWIAMKCLEKDRTRRYATANDLAMDIQRYLENEPVLARPPSNLYRLQKLYQRHRGAFAAAAAIATALLFGAALSTWQAVRATRAEHTAQQAQQQETKLRQQAQRERGRAEQERASARLNEYVADINLAQQSLAAENFRRAAELINKHNPRVGEADLRGFEWRYIWQLTQGDKHASFPTQEGSVHALAISPDAQWLAVAAREIVSIWNFKTQSLVTNLPTRGAMSLVFLDGGRALATAGRTTVRIWRTTNWSEQKSLSETSGPMAVSKDSSRLATLSRDGARVWDTRSWEEVSNVPGEFASIAISADGSTLAAAGNSGITLYPLAGGAPEVPLEDSTNIFQLQRFRGRFGVDPPPVFSPDGKWVVAARNLLSKRGVFVLSIWNTQTGREEASIPAVPEDIQHTGFISSLAFSPDGKTLATGSRDYSIRLWDFQSRQRLLTLHGHTHEVWTIAFSPDGQTLISGAKDGAVNLWPTHVQQREDIIAGAFQPLAWSRDGRTLAVLARSGSVAFLDPLTGEIEQEFPLEKPRQGPRGGPGGFGGFPFRTPFALSADLHILAQGLEDGAISLRNTDTGDATTLTNGTGRVEPLALSPDGRFLVTAAHNQNLQWWDLSHHTNAILAAEASQALFSPDGRTLALFPRNDPFQPRSETNIIQLWDTATLSPKASLAMDQPFRFTAAFSPDSRILAVPAQDDAIHLWDTATGRLLGACAGHKQPIFSIAFSADGRTLASASDDSTLKFWNVEAKQELLSFRRLGGSLSGLLFSPDGRVLVGASGFLVQPPVLRFFRAPLLKEIEAGSPPKPTG